MIRFLAVTALTLLGNSVGMWLAWAFLPGFELQPLGFVVSVAFFTAVEVLLGPFVLKMAIKYAPALRGGIALITTFLGLFLTATFTDGLTISGLNTWVLAPLIVWLGAVVAGILLPMVMFKKVLAGTGEEAPTVGPRA